MKGSSFRRRASIILGFTTRPEATFLNSTRMASTASRPWLTVRRRWAEVLPPSLTARVGVEAASPFGWERWTGTHGRIVAIDRFGESAPGGLVMERLGMTPGAIVEAARASLAEVTD